MDVVLWSRAIRTGEAAMCHSLENMEHHHFKFENHRRPGDLHVHYFGADAFSFGAGLVLQTGDVMCVQFEGFRPRAAQCCRRGQDSAAFGECAADLAVPPDAVDRTV